MLKKSIIVMGLIFLCALTRLLPHAVNFTPILAIGLFSGFYFKDKKVAWLPVVLSMVVVDLVIGFHSTSLVVYLAAGGAVMLSGGIRAGRRFAASSALMTVLASTLFFLVTNFGVWALTPMYGKTLSGLGQCYLAALPFFHNTLLSTALYFYGFVAVTKWMENTFFEKKQILN